MNNNDFYHTQDAPQESRQEEAATPQRTSYTTPEGGSGVHYHADDRRPAWEGSYQYVEEDATGAQKRARRGMGVTAVLIVALCIALGFGTGLFGSKLVAYLGEQSVVNEPAEQEAPGTQGGTTHFPSTDDLTNPGGASGEVSGNDRNPSPSLDKSDSLGSLTYSGSAGAAAYSTMAEAIDKVKDSVVEISTETVVNGGWLGNYVSSGAGSGVIISEDGYIVTNNHVIEDADNINVRLTDGTEYAAMLIGRDVATDVAVIWVDTQGVSLPAAKLGCSADLIVGEWVFAIGNPLGSLGGTVTNGIISATARSIVIDGQNMTLLQTNAAVNPGNSGGGLFNMAGQLIGVVNAKYSEDDVEGLGFAIPVDTAYHIIEQLIEYGYVRGMVDSGLTLYDITSANIMTAWRYFNSSYAGVYILESAHSDQLQYGDLLYAIDGVTVSNSKEVESVLSGYEVGDTVTLTVIRSEKEYQIELTLQEYVPSDLNVQFTPK